MASIKKNGKRWVAEVRTKGQYRSKTFDTKSEANSWSIETEAQLGKRGVTVSRTFREAMQRYAEEVSTTKKGARWEILRLKKQQRDKIADIMMCDLTTDDLEAWVGRQNVGPSSINRELTLFSSVIKHARLKWKWLSHDPIKDVQRKKDPPHRDRLISDDELNRLLLALEYDEAQPITTIRQEIAVAFLLALETAMRRGELWGLDWKYVYLDRRFVHLPDTKNGTKRDVALSARAVELFKKLGAAETGRVFKGNKDSADPIFRRAVKMAGIHDLTFHDSRHTAITRLARKLDVLDLARMVGHRDPRSLMVYYNATAEDIAKRL